MWKRLRNESTELVTMSDLEYIFNRDGSVCDRSTMLSLVIFVQLKFIEVLDHFIGV